MYSICGYLWKFLVYILLISIIYAGASARKVTFLSSLSMFGHNIIQGSWAQACDHVGTTYPSEKYEFVSWDNSSEDMEVS